MTRAVAILMLIGAVLTLGGCVVEAGRPGWRGGWCYYHPYRC
jgi:hypothetical protein